VVVGGDGAARCWWATGDPIYLRYHDEEWGRPRGDDVRLFEKLCLEGFQSGLSWLTILRKRESFRRAFAGFDIDAVARCARSSAASPPTFWGFEPAAASRPAAPDRDTLAQVTTSDQARAMSRDLRRRGWSFVGPTTAYSFMQAVGLVNDHLRGCAARDLVERDRAGFARPAPRSRPRE
jgi:DNA-3-methyladenine glycosylase I